MLIVLGIVLGVVVLMNAVLIVLLLRAKRPTAGQGESAALLKQDITNLSDNVMKLKDHLQAQVSDRMEKTQDMVQRTMTAQFKESSRLISEVSQRLTKLDETNKRVVGVADELKTLQNVLQNPKQRGVLGEYYLHSVLENVLTPDRFQMQYKFKDGEIVDAVIVLDKGKLLPIDSKFSLENYNRLIEAKDKETRAALVKLFKADLKNRIDETAKYIRPSEKTMDYAFMFIPSEAIYYDLLINRVGTTTAGVSRDLMEYAFRDKHVIIVSPTTFMAYLQTVLQGLRSLQIEEQAKEIQIRVGQLGRHLQSYELFMQKLGQSLGVTVGHYNTAHKELGKIDKDVIKIAGSTAGIEPVLLERPNLDTDE